MYLRYKIADLRYYYGSIDHINAILYLIEELELEVETLKVIMS